MSARTEESQWISEKLQAHHLERLAVVYVRQSTLQQVLDHQESTRIQYGLSDRAQALGWQTERILTIDEDLGKSGSSAEGRLGFRRCGHNAPFTTYVWDIEHSLPLSYS